MTFKITVVLRVSGRIDAEQVSELRAWLLRCGPNVVLDLDEVQLVGNGWVGSDLERSDASCSGG